MGGFDPGGDLRRHVDGVPGVRAGVGGHGVESVLVPAQGLSGAVQSLVRVTVLRLNDRDQAEHPGEVQRQGRPRGLQPGPRVRRHGSVGVGERGSRVPGDGVGHGPAGTDIADPGRQGRRCEPGSLVAALALVERRQGLVDQVRSGLRGPQGVQQRRELFVELRFVRAGVQLRAQDPCRPVVQVQRPQNEATALRAVGSLSLRAGLHAFPVELAHPRLPAADRRSHRVPPCRLRRRPTLVEHPSPRGGFSGPLAASGNPGVALRPRAAWVRAGRKSAEAVRPGGLP